MITKLSNGVLFITIHTKGYGGPSSYGLTAVYGNRLLYKNEFYSCCDQAVQLDRMKRMYGEMSTQDLATLAAAMPKAFPVCDQCETPLYKGCVSQGDLRRCKPCSDKTPYNEVDDAVNARAKARAEKERTRGKD